MKITKAGNNDTLVISSLNNAVQQLHAGAHPDIFKKPSADTFPVSFVERLLDDPEIYIYLALDEADHQALGYIWVQIIEKPETPIKYAQKHLLIHHISVESGHRKKGIGEKLIEKAMDLANENDISVIELDVWAFNENARRFFQQQGFSAFNIRMWKR